MLTPPPNQPTPEQEFEAALASRAPYQELGAISRVYIRRQADPGPFDDVGSWDAITPDGAKEYSQDARWLQPLIEWTLDLRVGPWVHCGRRWGHVNSVTGVFTYMGYRPIKTQFGRMG